MLLTEKIYMPRESFPIPLNYIEVVRHTQTTVDILHEHKIIDYWNVEEDPPLSGSWIGFTGFIVCGHPKKDNNSNYVQALMAFGRKYGRTFP